MPHEKPTTGMNAAQALLEDSEGSFPEFPVFPIVAYEGFKPKVRGVWNRDGFLAALNHDTEDSPCNAFLRLYVDEWLNTGIEENGSETPNNRDFTKVKSTYRAIQRFSSKYPVRLDVGHDGVSVTFESDPGVNATQAIFGIPPRDSADRQFAVFCLSGWHPRLAKCRHADCGRYFWLKHWNRTYRDGTLCPECTRARSLQSAVRSTAKARRAAETELYRLAAKQFSKRIAKEPSWHKDPKLRTAIIGFLNNRIKDGRSLSSAYPHGITGKWLSWSKNRRGIEKTATGQMF